MRDSIYYGKQKTLPISFFEKKRPEAPRDSLKNTVPFKWSNEEEILSGKKRNEVIIQLPSY